MCIIKDKAFMHLKNDIFHGVCLWRRKPSLVTEDEDRIYDRKEGIIMKKKGLLCLLTAGLLALSACGSSSNFQDEVVMRINDREIMKSEYMVYLYTTTASFTAVGGNEIWTMDFDGQTADELVEERTLSTIQSVIAAEEYAAKNDITLTDAQKEEAKQASEQFIANAAEADLAKMGVDQAKLEPFMEGSYLYSLVYQALAEECAVDETEMNAYYEENQAQLAEDYTMIDMDSIVTDSLETANEIVEKARAGEDFQELFTEYDIDENEKQAEGDGNMQLYQSQLKASFGITELPEIGEISDPIAVEEVYFVVRLNTVTVPEETEVKTLAERQFTATKQAEYSDLRFEEMMAAQEIEYIEGVFENLEKFH